ncbi:MAG: hypothetical protein WBX10_19440 [Candidatus Sulfotelmatobacter sp.]
MSLGQGIVQFERLAAGLVRQQASLPRGDADSITGGNVVGIGEAGVSESVFGVGRDRLLE